jgi:branched-chain amino acid transport system ATP-binding protein
MRVEVTSLESGYGSATVLRGTDIRVDDGAALAVVGRNGMGKTTLLRTILGYLRPSAGTVALDGVDVTGWLPERVVRRGVGYGPQDEAVFADLSVADNLAASSHRTDPRRRAEVLDHFPTIGQRLRQRAGTLSGGEQKMLTLCRVLLGGPRLLILDEITDGLQPSVVDTVIRVLRWERHERGTTLLLVEQNIDVSLAVCDRVAVLKRGQLIAETPVDAPTVRSDLFGLLSP